MATLPNICCRLLVMVCYAERLSHSAVIVFCNMAPNKEPRPSANPVVKDPLFGFLPRKVTAKQVLTVMASPSTRPVSAFPHTLMLQMGEVNPFNKTSFSASYKRILDGRENLPVFGQMHEFYEMVRRSSLNAQKDFTHPHLDIQYSNNQIVIMVGETGSGKTTQYGSSFTVLKSLLINCQDTSVCCLFRSSTHQRQNCGMHSTSSCCSHVCCETGGRRNGWCVHDYFQPLRTLSCFFAVSLGKEVGYTIRFEDMTDPGATFLKYMTDGMLLREVRFHICWFLTSVVYVRKRLLTTHFCNATRQSSSMKRMSELSPRISSWGCSSLLSRSALTLSLSSCQRHLTRSSSRNILVLTSTTQHSCSKYPDVLTRLRFYTPQNLNEILSRRPYELS